MEKHLGLAGTTAKQLGEGFLGNAIGLIIALHVLVILRPVVVDPLGEIVLFLGRNLQAKFIEKAEHSSVNFSRLKGLLADPFLGGLVLIRLFERIGYGTNGFP